MGTSPSCRMRRSWRWKSNSDSRLPRFEAKAAVVEVSPLRKVRHESVPDLSLQCYR